MTINPYSHTHRSEVIKIAKLCFGDNYITETNLLEHEKSECQSFVISEKGLTIGFCLLKTNTRETIPIEFRSYIPNKKKIGIIQTIAILPEFQLQGYGSLLLKHCVVYLQKQQNSESILYPAWIENDKDYFLNKLKTVGFAPIRTFPYFWKRESLKEKYSCVNCGEPPCSCSLKLYRLV